MPFEHASTGDFIYINTQKAKTSHPKSKKNMFLENFPNKMTGQGSARKGRQQKTTVKADSGRAYGAEKSEGSVDEGSAYYTALTRK
jgi:hypothetical protein